MKASDFRRTITIPEPRRKSILDSVGSLSGSAEDGADASQARDTDVGVGITQPGGRTSFFTVPARATGPNTLCFLHSGFLHTGTRCEVFALREAGPVSVTTGDVRWVQHVDGGTHAIGIRFESAIDPQNLISDIASRRVARTASLSDIRGRILVLDDQRVDAELARMHLRAIGLDVILSSDTTTAIAALQPTPPDVLICDLNLSNGMPGETAIKVLHRRGFTGPVVVLTAEENELRLKAARDTGAFAVVQKPYERKDLLVAVTSALVKAGAIRVRTRSGAAPGDLSPVYSTLPWSEDAIGLVAMYIEQTRTLASGLAGAIAQKDTDAIRRTCLTLKGTGAGYGFESLTRAAVQALDVLAAGAESDTLGPALDEIRSLISRLAPPVKAA